MSRTTYEIVFDYDDIIYPWSNRAHKLCVEAGTTGGNEVDRWRIWESYGCEEQVFWDVLSSATVSGELYDDAPISGVLAQMQRLRGHGHRIHIVTARGFGQHGALIQALTREQVRNWNVPMDSLTFSQDKTVVPAHFAIDDGLHNYWPLDEAGVMVFLMDMWHNQIVPAPVRRVKSVREFADLVLGSVKV